MGSHQSNCNSGNSSRDNNIYHSNVTSFVSASKPPQNYAQKPQLSTSSSYAPTYAANAYPRNLRLFYSPHKLTSSNLIKGTELTSGGSVESIVLEAGTHIQCPVYEDLYVTAFPLEDPGQPFHCSEGKPLFENFLSETASGQHRSAVITASGEPRFTKEGEIWMDEDGQDHEPRK